MYIVVGDQIYDPADQKCMIIFNSETDQAQLKEILPKILDGASMGFIETPAGTSQVDIDEWVTDWVARVKGVKKVKTEIEKRKQTNEVDQTKQ